LGVAAALADELANPAPIIDQLERNQSGLSPESTDGEMNLAGAELIETTDLKVCPLVGSASDTVEDYLHQVTGNIPAQATGSVGTSACGNIPGQSTGSLEAQETGSPEAQAAEESEVVTIASSAELASAHAMVYPNFGPVNPTIIIENNNRPLPVMDSNVAEAPGGLERGRYGATVKTGVAGTEQKTRTGQQYTQISSTHVEPVLEEFRETSRKCCSHLGQTVTPGATARAHTWEGNGMPLEGWMTTVQEAQSPGLSEESSARQTSFTKLKAEVEMESENEVITDRRSKSEVVMPDLSSSRRSNSTGDEAVVQVLHPDVRSDQPTSMIILPSPEEFNEGVGVLTSGETNPEGPMEPEEYKKGEILYSNIDVAMPENENVSGSEPAPGSENAPNETMSYSPNSERQRPTRATRRPTRFRDSDFETQFQPKERKRKCTGSEEKTKPETILITSPHAQKTTRVFVLVVGSNRKSNKKKSERQQEAD